MSTSVNKEALDQLKASRNKRMQNQKEKEARLPPDNMSRAQPSNPEKVLVPSSSPTTSPGQPSKYYSTGSGAGPSNHQARPPAPKMHIFGDQPIPRIGVPRTDPTHGRAGQSASQSSFQGAPTSMSTLEPPRKKQAFATSPFSSQASSRPTSPSSQGSGYGSSAMGASSLGERMGRTNIGESSGLAGHGNGTGPPNGLIKSRMLVDEDGDETMASGDSSDMAATPDGKAPLSRFARRPAGDVSSHSPISLTSTPDRTQSVPIPSEGSNSNISEKRSPENDATYAQRMLSLYSKELTIEAIMRIMDEYPEDRLSTVAKRVSAAARKQDYRSVKASTGSLLTSPAIAANATPIQDKVAMGTVSPMAFSRVGKEGTIQPYSSYTPPPQAKKVKESAIYANRRVDDRDRERERASGSTSTNGGGSANFPNRGKKRKTGGDDSASDDGDGAYREGGKRKSKDEVVEYIDEDQVLAVFNTCLAAELTGSIVCTQEQAESIISLRPFASVEELKKKLARKKGVSFSLFEQYQNVMQGYIEVDRCLAKCEEIGTVISEIMDVWTGTSGSKKGKEKEKADGSRGHDVDIKDEEPADDEAVNNDTGLHISSVNASELKTAIGKERNPRRRELLGRYQFEQPKYLDDGVKLKDYQLVGLNWLSLLHREDYSCILADEMGLGKTIQVIAFFCLLKQQGRPGPHLVVVPSSTLENWVREFQKFASEIKVQTYYGGQNERYQLRKDFQQQAEDGELEVLITTYDMAWKADDHKFLRKKMSFDCAVFDEGHTLKNFESQRYKSLIAIKPRWRLLLTGTPLQNNLQELVSLLNFILPEVFEEAEEHLRQIFKVHAKGTANLLSQQRVSRARTMMTPFVLRRRKAQVLKDLPPRTDRVQTCAMTNPQRSLYDGTLRRSRKVLEEIGTTGAGDDEHVPAPAKGRKGVLKIKDDGSANILMDLRKATNHPLLFRRVYTDAKIRLMARDCMNEPEFVDSVRDMIVEDMEVMTDAELYGFCKRYKSVNKYTIPIKHFTNVGKIQALEKLLTTCVAEGRRMLLFSQFTQILDILQIVLKHWNYRYIRLDGSTKVDERQGLVDEFTEDEDIKVFLLSTRAGGMGINLVAASVVCIYDQDFNPHNDRQAADRAYRIGQTRKVEVIKLLSENTIDENIYQLGVTKLKLDDAVGGGTSGATGDSLVENGGTENTATANEMKKSLLTTVKAKADEIVALNGEEEEDVVSDGE